MTETIDKSHGRPVCKLHLLNNGDLKMKTARRFVAEPQDLGPKVFRPEAR